MGLWVRHNLPVVLSIRPDKSQPETDMRTFFPISSVLLLALLSTPAALDGQAAKRVAATVAVADAAPEGARFLVKRFPGGPNSDVIVLAPDATGAELSSAVRTLLIVRQREGDVPRIKRTVRIRPGSNSIAAQAPLPWAARVLGDASRSARAVVPGVGSVRAVQIWLPGQDARRPAKSVSPRT